MLGVIDRLRVGRAGGRDHHPQAPRDPGDRRPGDRAARREDGGQRRPTRRRLTDEELVRARWSAGACRRCPRTASPSASSRPSWSTASRYAAPTAGLAVNDAVLRGPVGRDRRCRPECPATARPSCSRRCSACGPSSRARSTSPARTMSRGRARRRPAGRCDRRARGSRRRRRRPRTHRAPAPRPRRPTVAPPRPRGRLARGRAASMPTTPSARGCRWPVSTAGSTRCPAATCSGCAHPGVHGQ